MNYYYNKPAQYWLDILNYYHSSGYVYGDYSNPYFKYLCDRCRELGFMRSAAIPEDIVHLIQTASYLVYGPTRDD